MITLKEATQIAAEKMREVYPTAESTLVEEIEMDDNKAYWLITLSFPVESDDLRLPVTIREAFSTKVRKYKTFKIDAETGEMISMKIRELQS